MHAKKYRWNTEQYLQLAHAPNHADIKKTVVKDRAWDYFHAASIAMSIADSDEERLAPDRRVFGGETKFERGKGQEFKYTGEQVSGSAPQPCGHAVGAGVGPGIESHAGHTTEKSLLPVMAEDPEVDLTNILTIRAVPAPRPQGGPAAIYPQRAGKIIAAAGGHDQNRDGALIQSGKMTVNRSVAAENQSSVRAFQRIAGFDAGTEEGLHVADRGAGASEDSDTNMAIS